MAYEDRSYSGNAVPATLTANITNTATTIPISASTGWPDGTSGPFHVAIATAANPTVFTEVIRCSGRTGLNLSVQTVPVNGRGWDGTTASSHLSGAVIKHVFTATDADEANQHIVNAGLDHHTQYLTVSRHDLSARHGFGILPTVGTPSTSVVGDTAATGSSNNVARVDHRHAREVFGSPVSAGPVTGDGVATSVPRSDHLHAGGVPILTSATRPASPIAGQAIIESDTRRLVVYSGTRWVRTAAFSFVGRTGAYVGRTIVYSIPDAGASSYVLPWNSELTDTDGFIPAPDGTTTTTLTVPNDETAGVYAITGHLAWATLFTQRSYIEILHGFGGSYNQHRVSSTGEDRATISATLDLGTGDTIQLGLWQNSGVAQNVSGAYLTMFRLFD